MAVHLPCLPGSPSVSRRVPTSFVPPAHIQGVILALLQGRAPWSQLPADYWLILSCLLADSSSCSPAPFGGRFLMSFPFRHSLSGAGLLLVTGTGPLIRSAARFRPQAVATLCPDSCCQAAVGLRMSPIIFAASYVTPVCRIR